MRSLFKRQGPQLGVEKRIREIPVNSTEEVSEIFREEAGRICLAENGERVFGEMAVTFFKLDGQMQMVIPDGIIVAPDAHTNINNFARPPHKDPTPFYCVGPGDKFGISFEAEVFGSHFEPIHRLAFNRPAAYYLSDADRDRLDLAIDASFREVEEQIRVVAKGDGKFRAHTNLVSTSRSFHPFPNEFLLPVLRKTELGEEYEESEYVTHEVRLHGHNDFPEEVYLKDPFLRKAAERYGRQRFIGLQSVLDSNYNRLYENEVNSFVELYGGERITVEMLISGVAPMLDGQINKVYWFHTEPITANPGAVREYSTLIENALKAYETNNIYYDSRVDIQLFRDDSPLFELLDFTNAYTTELAEKYFPADRDVT